MRLGWATLFACVAVAGRAAAQQTPLPPGAVKLDAGVGDRPLGVGRVDLRQDLRQQNDFSSVYRFTTPNPYGGPGQHGQQMLMRIEGGLTAVFPQSVYVPTARGQQAVVPPGTTFYIGDLPKPWTTEPAPTTPRAPNYLDLRADTRVHGATEPAQANGPPPWDSGATTIWNSESFRTRTVGSLIDRAAAGGR